MKTKNYEAPETEVVVVRIERQIMSPAGFSTKTRTEIFLEEDDDSNI